MDGWNLAAQAILILLVPAKASTSQLKNRPLFGQICQCNALSSSTFIDYNQSWFIQ